MVDLQPSGIHLLEPYVVRKGDLTLSVGRHKLILMVMLRASNMIGYMRVEYLLAEREERRESAQ